jgi:hypothetical protein
MIKKEFKELNKQNSEDQIIATDKHQHFFRIRDFTLA